MVILKKGTPFRIEMFDDHYEAVRSVFDKDWPHKVTKAPMLKSNIQSMSYIVAAYMLQMA